MYVTMCCLRGVINDNNNNNKVCVIAVWVLLTYSQLHCLSLLPPIWFFSLAYCTAWRMKISINFCNKRNWNLVASINSLRSQHQQRPFAKYVICKAKPTQCSSSSSSSSSSSRNVSLPTTRRTPVQSSNNWAILII